jgi:adenosylcobinamide-phosphate synthase
VIETGAATALATLLVAMLVDAVAGEPAWLYRRVPHPVVLIGRAIGRLERRLLVPSASDARKRTAGVLLLAVVAGGAWLLGMAVHRALQAVPLGWLAEGVLLSTLLAQRSLVDHVLAVARGLERGLAEGGKAVAMIVGRDPERLDGPGVARAAI